MLRAVVCLTHAHVHTTVHFFQMSSIHTHTSPNLSLYLGKAFLLFTLTLNFPSLTHVPKVSRQILQFFTRIYHQCCHSQATTITISSEIQRQFHLLQLLCHTSSCTPQSSSIVIQSSSACLHFPNSTLFTVNRSTVLQNTHNISCFPGTTSSSAHLTDASIHIFSWSSHTIHLWRPKQYYILPEVFWYSLTSSLLCPFLFSPFTFLLSFCCFLLYFSVTRASSLRVLLFHLPFLFHKQLSFLIPPSLPCLTWPYPTLPRLNTSLPHVDNACLHKINLPFLVHSSSRSHSPDNLSPAISPHKSYPRSSLYPSCHFLFSTTNIHVCFHSKSDQTSHQLPFLVHPRVFRLQG